MQGFVFAGQRTWLALPVMALAILAAYLPGLDGPFLLDDLPNLEPVQRWLAGDLSWQRVLAAGESGPLGRPLSLLAFMGIAGGFGFSAFAFKAGNLALHLVNAGLLGWLLVRLSERSPWLASRIWLPWAIATIWALLPMHAATVLYPVQLMTLLSVTFVLVAMLFWIHARRRQEQGLAGAGWWLWLGVPVATGLGALAKESALLAPLLCLVCELALFPAGGRPAQTRWFFRAAVLPVLAGLAWLATHPAYVLAGYAERGFSFEERLLTQPRALWSYIGATFLPVSAPPGLYQDALQASQGWMDPPATLWAALALAALAVSALLLARRIPLYAAGIGLFLVGHAMEGSIFALELAFLHRNYLPSVGLVLAAAALLARLPVAFNPRTPAVLLGLLALTLGLATAGRASIWSDRDSLLARELQRQPDSLRLRSDLAAAAIAAGRTDAALVHLDAALPLARPEDRRAVRMWRLLAYCAGRRPPPPAELDALVDGQPLRISAYTQRALDLFANASGQGLCEADAVAGVSAAVLAWIELAPQSHRNPAVWKSRYAVSRLLAMLDQPADAQALALRAYADGGADAFPVGVHAYWLSAERGDLATCRRLYRELSGMRRTGDRRETDALEGMRRHLADVGTP